MTTNNRSVGKSSVRAGISAVGICRAPSSRQTSSSLASRTSRTVRSFPALSMSASSRTEIASEPLRGSVDIARLLPDLQYCRTYVGLKAGQETFRRKPPSNLEPFVALHELAHGEEDYAARRQNNPRARTHARRTPRTTAPSERKAARGQRSPSCENACRTP